MALRLGTPDDNEMFSEMIKVLIDDSRYKYFFNGDHEFTKEIVNSLTDPTQFNSGVVFSIDGDKVVGFCAFELVPAMYTPLMMARVVGIYLDKEYRGQGRAAEMRKAFEYWGKAMGADWYNIGVSTPDTDLTNDGYEQYEIMFMKEVN